MKEVSALVSEGKRPLDESEVVRYRRGDIVKVHGVYAVVTGFFKNERGNRCIQLGLPVDALGLQRWALANPHQVKYLQAGLPID